MRLATAPLACAVLLPGTALAFLPLVTDDTGTQGTGGNQVEAAYNRTVDEAPGTRDVAHQVPLVFTRGLTDALDVYAGAGYQRLVPTTPATTEHGWGNLAVGAKWRFYEDEASKMSFGLKPELRFPVSKEREARGLGTARHAYSVGLLMTKETGFGAIHANLVAERVHYADDALDSAERRMRYRVSAAPVWDVAENWKLALDVGLVTNPDQAARSRMGYMELGAIYAPTKDLDFAVGIVRNVMDGAADTTQATVGITWRFR